MLTLKFETDLFRTGNDGHSTMMIEARHFRTRQHADGTVDVLVENEHGVEISYTIGDSLEYFNRCFVMNSAGQTVGRYTPQPPVPPAPNTLQAGLACEGRSVVDRVSP